MNENSVAMLYIHSETCVSLNMFVYVWFLHDKKMYVHEYLYVNVKLCHCVWSNWLNDSPRKHNDNSAP